MNKLKRDFALGYVVGFNSAPVTEAGYKPDADWLPLPPALPGQITLLVNDTVEAQINIGLTGNGLPYSYTVNWGDGTVHTYTNDVIENSCHTYTTGGHLISNGTKQYIVTISAINNIKFNGINDVGGGLLLASINVDVSADDSMLKNTYELCQIDILYPITTLPYEFCYGCRCLKKINIVSTVLSSINDYAVAYCYALETLDLSKSIVASIGNYAVTNGYTLTSVKLPKTVTNIGNSSFYYNFSLSDINIPIGCTKGTNAFYECKSLHPTP